MKVKNIGFSISQKAMSNLFKHVYSKKKGELNFAFSTHIVQIYNGTITVKTNLWKETIFGVFLLTSKSNEKGKRTSTLKKSRFMT